MIDLRARFVQRIRCFHSDVDFGVSTDLGLLDARRRLFVVGVELERSLVSLERLGSVVGEFKYGKYKLYEN